MDVRKHLGQYAIAYGLMVVATGAVAVLVDLPPSVAAIIPLAAVTYPLQKFVGEHRREPTPGERTTLSLAFVGLFLAVQVVVLAIAAALYPDVASEVVADPTVVLLIVGLGVVVPGVGMWAAIRVLPCRHLRNLERAEARKAARGR